MKSKNYITNIIVLQSGTGGMKCNDVPWPYSVDVVEITNVMFHDHSLSRVVVPATLHNISVNAHFTRFL